MSYAAPPPSGGEPPKRKISFLRNAAKNKHSFIQFFCMTGIFLLSIRSLGQKYAIHSLLEDKSALQKEQESLSQRLDGIKTSLFHEASLDSTGVFASRLKALFGDDNDLDRSKHVSDQWLSKPLW